MREFEAEAVLGLDGGGVAAPAPEAASARAHGRPVIARVLCWQCRQV